MQCSVKTARVVRIFQPVSRLRCYVSLNCSNLSSPPKLFFQLALINWKSRVVCHKPQLHHLYLQVSYHNYGQVQIRKNWSKAIISRYRFQDGCLTCFYNIMEKQHSHFPFEVKELNLTIIIERFHVFTLADADACKRCACMRHRVSVVLPVSKGGDHIYSL